MTNFSTNQVMQFYVLDGSATVVTGINGEVYVKFTDAKGEVRTSDKIENVMWGKLTSASAMATPYTKAVIALDENVNGGAPVAGQNYAIRVSYPEVGGLGNEGWTTKVVVITATSQIATAGALYAELGVALAKAFANDGVLTVTTDDGTVITETSKVEDLVGAAGLIITQSDPTTRYKRGLRPVKVADFNISASFITFDGEEVQPFAKASFDVVKGDKVIKTGYKVADMEYFAMGERGDQYRNVDYINAIDTEYKVDPTKDYAMLVVHFAYAGANQNSHKSEKDLIVVGTDESALKTLGTAIATATGAKFTKVSGSAASATEAALS